MTSYNLEICSDKDKLSLRARDFIIESLNKNLKEKGYSNISLSGGSTPIPVYNLLSNESINWKCVNIFLGDERWVPQNSPLSNQLMLKKCLLLDGKASQESNFYSFPTTDLATPEQSADAYTEILRKHFKGKLPSFDLILLGLGDDGHTASLFPSTNALVINDKWITVGESNSQKRITFTSLLLSNAKKVVFLVSGKAKQLALQRLLDPDESWERTPAKLVKPKSEVLVLADETAVKESLP